MDIPWSPQLWDSGKMLFRNAFTVFLSLIPASSYTIAFLLGLGKNPATVRENYL